MDNLYLLYHCMIYSWYYILNKDQYLSHFWIIDTWSLTWKNCIWRWFLSFTIIPVTSQWGCYNLYSDIMAYLIISYLCNWHTYMSRYAISYYYIYLYIILHIKHPACIFIFICFCFFEKSVRSFHIGMQDNIISFPHGSVWSVIYKV
jgi:hypothetical protein